MPTGSGVLTLGSFGASGAGNLPVPDPGPNTRNSTVFFEVRFSGVYSDEFEGKPMAVANWSADGFKFTETPGTGQTTPGQSNRFWKRQQFRLESMSAIDFDMFSFLSLEGGKGFGQDQLGLGINMKQNTLLIIRNNIGGAPLRIGGSSHAPWTSLINGTMIIPSGYEFFAATQNINAWEIEEGVNQYLRMASTGGACIIDIYIGGRYF